MAYILGKFIEKIVGEINEKDNDDTSEEIRQYSDDHSYESNINEDYEEDEEDYDMNNDNNGVSNDINNNLNNEIYDAFKIYSSFSDCGIGLDHVNHIIGKIHLCDSSNEISLPREGIFHNIFYSLYSGSTACMKVKDTKDTFLILKKVDYIYSDVIDKAFLDTRGKRSDNNIYFDKDGSFDKDNKILCIIDNFYDKYQSYRTQKRLNYKPCNNNHIISERKCPNDWIVYTKTNSEFFEYIKEKFTNNITFDFKIGQSFTQIERLSFYIVLFLLGDNEDFQSENVIDYIVNNKDNHIDILSNHKTIEKTKYRDINEWVSLPLWVFLLWENRNIMNTNDQYGY